jgi:hypothetical protein
MPHADDIGMLFEGFAYDERGEGVIRFFRGVVSDPRWACGSWSSTTRRLSWLCTSHPEGFLWSIDNERSLSNSDSNGLFCRRGERRRILRDELLHAQRSLPR